MRAQESRVTVALVSDLSHYPYEVWDLALQHLDMFTEEVIDELGTIPWAEGEKYPRHSTVAAQTGEHNWGASGSFSEIVMQVSTNAGGGVGAVALTAAIKSVYDRLKSRAHGDARRSVPSLEEAALIAKSSLYRHYDVAADGLTVVRSSIDIDAQRYELTFRHEDGRKFGAVVGALAGMPSCTRVWAEGDDLLPRPELEPSSAGD